MTMDMFFREERMNHLAHYLSAGIVILVLSLSFESIVDSFSHNFPNPNPNPVPILNSALIASLLDQLEIED